MIPTRWLRQTPPRLGAALRRVWLPVVLLASGGLADGTIRLEGRVHTARDEAPQLEVSGKRIPLAGESTELSATLQDPRLSGRRLELEGEFREDGTFVIEQFFVLRGDSRYRLVYFCDICNITTFRPGACICCQQPVHPIEVDTTDPRIYHPQDETRPGKSVPR